jgi:hypothetical protein
MDSARFTAPKQQMTRGGGRGGSRTTALPKKVAEPFKPANDMKFPGAVPPPLMSQTARPADGVSGVGSVSSMPWDAGNRVDAANRSAQDYNDQAWGAYRARVLAETGRDVGGVPTASSGGAVPSIRQPQAQQPQVQMEIPKSDIDRVNSQWEALAKYKATNQGSPEDIAEMERQIWANQMGLKEMPKIKAAETTIQEDFDESTIVDENGNRFARDSSGKWQKLADAPKAEKDKSMDDLDKIAAKIAEKDEKDIADEIKPAADALSREQIAEKAKAEYKKQQEIRAILRGGGPKGATSVTEDAPYMGPSSPGGSRVPARNPAAKLANVAAEMVGQAQKAGSGVATSGTNTVTGADVAPNQNFSSEFDKKWNSV